MPYKLIKPIVIRPYDPAWETEYAAERARFVTAFAHAGLAEKVREIHHIGSTSVPGLAAKAIVDISIFVDDLAVVDGFLPALRRLGYEDTRINPKFGRRLFSRGLYNEGAHHAAFAVHGNEGWRDALLFRDYLRSHPDAVIRYAKIKRECAALHGNDIDGYSVGKGDVIRELMEEARIWRSATNV